jgi:light-regulated signal transduction histidine kinase (bacteriophytochrome)
VTSFQFVIARHWYLRYGAAVLFAPLAQLARIPIEPPTLIPYITYVPFIVFSAWLCGTRPGLLTGALCIVQVTYFALEPVGQFRVARAQDYLGMAALATSATAISFLVGQLHETAARLRARTAELERSNEDLQAYAYSVSHDLQEPLRNVSLYVDLLNRRCAACVATDPQRQQILKVIGTGAKRMSTMLSSLLVYSRATNDNDSPEWMDSAEIVAGVLAVLASRIQTTGAVVTVQDLPRVYAWRGGLEQVFQNLIDNALKYRSNERDPEITIGCSCSRSLWSFCISDNGIGFDEEYAEKIFGVFKRLHGPGTYEGTGIGLAIVRRIVNRHGGKAWAKSTPGQGSSFCFTLPTPRGRNP